MFTVDLSSRGIANDEELAAYDIQGVDSLNVNRNCFRKLPKCGNPRLKYIEFSHNELVNLEGLGQLYPSLVSIKGGNNKIVFIPKDDLKLMPSLSFLSLFGNSICMIPEEIGCLRTLTVLSLSRNNISTVPIELAHCTQLKELYLAENKICRFSHKFHTLSQLKTLDLSRNKFVDIPVVIAAFTKLGVFVFTGNPLKREYIAHLTTAVKEIQYQVFARLEWSFESHRLLQSAGASTACAILSTLWLCAMRLSSRLHMGSIPQEIVEMIATHLSGADFWWPSSAGPRPRWNVKKGGRIRLGAPPKM